MDDKTRAAINGANARCLNRITGRGVHVEASTRSRTFDLVGAIRKRKYKWLGHIMRMKRCRLVKHAVAVQFANGKSGDIFMDAPTNFTYRMLEQLAQLRSRWRQRNFSPLPQRPAPTTATNTTTRAAQRRHFSPIVPPRGRLVEVRLQGCPAGPDAAVPTDAEDSSRRGPA